MREPATFVARAVKRDRQDLARVGFSAVGSEKYDEACR